MTKSLRVTGPRAWVKRGDAWALTEPARQAGLKERLFRLFFRGSPMTLGEAVKQAKAAVSDPDVRRSWILFGDPSMRLR